MIAVAARSFGDGDSCGDKLGRSMLRPYQVRRSARSRRVGLQELHEMLSDDLFLAGFQHERIHPETAIGRAQHDRRRSATKGFAGIARRERDFAWIPEDAHVRDVIGDIRNVERGRYARDASDFAGHIVETTPPFFVESSMVFIEIAL